MEIAGVGGQSTVDSAGQWKVLLDLSKTESGPFDLEIKTTAQAIVVKDVLIGEVWLASGQSNMEWPLKETSGASEEIKNSGNSKIRYFNVPKSSFVSPSNEPLDELNGNWVIAAPDKSGDFTAVGYYFSKNLQTHLQSPVGLIDASWGGTAVEAWTSREGLNQNPDLKLTCEKTLQEIESYAIQRPQFLTQFQAWVAKNGRVDQAYDKTKFADANVSVEDWKKVEIPGKFCAAGLPDSGVVWIRKKIVLTAESAAKGNAAINLVNPDGFETVYFNGSKLGEVNLENYKGAGSVRTYYPHPSIKVVGENVIAVRIYSPSGGSGISGDAKKIAYGTKPSTPLNGDWFGKAEYEFPKLDDESKKGLPAPLICPPVVTNPLTGPPVRPAHLYNGMIHPVERFSIKGVIWYQGEANAVRGYQYRYSFPLMIQDWRKRRGEDFPFFFCQLAAFLEKKSSPSESGWADIRESQSKVLSLPNTGQSVLIDIGDTANIHQTNKKEIGHRLSLLALARTYGKNVVDSGPIYDSLTIEENQVRLRFETPTGGLLAKQVPSTFSVDSSKGATAPLIRNRPNSSLEGFQICGADQNWLWADAEIDGETVLVSNANIPKPTAVRYCWGANPTGNLFNQAGLPAGPFRTDDFKLPTEEAKY